MKESYESGLALNDSDFPLVEEETKQSVARFESIREELKNVKEELYTHISEVDEKVCEETNLEEQIESQDESNKDVLAKDESPEAES